MKIFPAIDLMNLHCVRLEEGCFDNPIVYSADPVSVAQEFQRQGAEFLHVVDLDGARAGSPCQTGLIIELIKQSGLQVQIGGGLRTPAQIAELIEAGARRVVIGSLAFKNRGLFIELVQHFGADRFTLALDFKNEEGAYRIKTHGWLESDAETVWDAVRALRRLGINRYLCTDIARDGKLAGPNFDFYREFRERFPDSDVLASGGIAALSDLKTLGAAGAFGAIVGKALYENRFTLEAALGLAPGVREC